MTSPTAVDHPTLEERAARGKDARAEAPRSAHGDWAPAADRRDPIEILSAQAETRVQELVPIRYGRMLVSAFTFYRGAAAVMAADLAGTPTSGITTQVCGDAHLSNFGGFAAPDRETIFDLNDFDETLPGPWEFDVKRLAASLAIAARDRGLDDKTGRRIVRAAMAHYREQMRTFAGMRNLDVWYWRLDGDRLLGELGAQLTPAARKRAERGAAKAARKNSLRGLSKLTHEVDGEPRFLSEPPLLVPVSELFPEQEADVVVALIRDLLRSYRTSLRPDLRRLVESFRYVDLARKVVGVGSVGTRAWVVLLLGRDDADPLVLQVKEAQASVLEEHVGASRYGNSGRRVVEGQRAMQAAGDILLGWLPAEGPDGVTRDFYVRQLWDGKWSAQVEAMEPATLELYGEACGEALARAHARSGDRVAIAAYLGAGDRFDVALAAFAEAYADQNERDYAALVAAVRSGRIEVREGL